MVVSVLGISAQSNEGYVGASFLRENVKFTQIKKAFDENTDSLGINLAGTHYVNKSNFGLTADFGANFDTNSASLVTLTAGGTFKARNYKYAQPFVHVLGGIARQNVNRSNITDVTNVSPALLLGGGIDFNTRAKSDYKVRVGADLVSTRFGNERQDGLRATIGLVF